MDFTSSTGMNMTTLLLPPLHWVNLEIVEDAPCLERTPFVRLARKVPSVNAIKEMLGLKDMKLKGAAVFSLLLPARTSHAVFNISIFSRPFHMVIAVEQPTRSSAN